MKTHLFKILAVIGCLLSNVILYAHQFESDGIYYNVINYTTKTVEVTYRGSSYGSYDNEYTGAVVIPDSVTYQGVTYSVTTIDGYAFYDCNGMTEITIPNNVTSIGGYAFYWCSGLTEITIPNSVTSISGYAFDWCIGLTEIRCLATTPPTISSSTFSNYSATLFVPRQSVSAYKAANYWENFSIKKIPDCLVDGLYYNILSTTDVEVTYKDSNYNSYSDTINIPETIEIESVTYSVTSIGDDAFSGCTGLVEITIPNSVTSIGYDAFSGCTGLTSVTIPNSVTAIGYYAFNGCSSLKSLTIEDGDSELKLGYNGSNEGLFYDCPIEILYIGRNLSYNTSYSYGYSPFYNKKELKTVTIGNSVTSIGSAAFEGCTSLTEITIGNSVTSIGETAFYNCTGLTSVIIPNSVTSIGDYAFYGCTGLTSITIPEGVTSIGEYAFIDCTGLTTINFNAQNCTTMGSSMHPVFKGCSNLTTLNIGESVKTIPAVAFDAFYGCNIAKTIWLTNTPPNGYKNVSSKVHYVANEQYTGLSNVKIYPYISSLFETGGVKYVPVSPSERTCDAIDCLYNKNVTDVKIDSTVSYRGVAMTVMEVMPYTLYNQDYIKTLSINNSGNIGNYTCYDCDSISSAILTNNGNVGEEAFYSCKNLTTATLGDSIKSIGNDAFSNCTSLSEIVIPNGVISIGESAFNGCTSMTKAIVGNGVTSIGSSAFGGCASLDSIYIGRKVATVGENAFSDCKKLADITIPASVTTIGDYVFSGCTSLSDVVIEDRTTALSLGSNGSSGLFANCPLDSVYIGGKITYKTSSSYGYSPFYRNTSLRTVVITDTETEIYDNEFYGCSNLTKVTIGDGVKKIGNWAFSGCSSLDHFAFGTNVESIGQEAFSDCTNVTNIRSYSAVPPVCGTQALDDINKWNCTLSVLENCQSAYQTAEQWKDFFFVNAMDKDGKVATPVITVDSVVVTISCKTAKTTIYYTTDGSEPTVESAQYTGPFVVDKNCTIKAIAVRTNYYNSDVSTAQVDYFVYAESIAIDYETVSIRLNESVTLTATVLPETTANRVVVWSSSDENIATVENGIVTAHTIGEATITATTTDGTNLSATCKVTVLPILADTITLDQTNITAIAGETVVLTATIYPEDATEKAVVWSVSDATIATIEPLDNVSAKITVLKEGVATITATTIDGSNLSATCTIDVYSGIKNVQLDDTPTEYYDLSGRRVEHPTQGVYITKQGSTVRKVVVNER